MPVRCKFWHKPVRCRTSPWHFIWGTTGKMRGCPSPAPTTKAWPLTAGWWRRSGSPTCSSSTPSVPSSTTPPQTTSCCGSSQTGRYFIASGKAAFGQCKLLVEWERKHFNWFLYCGFAWLHTKKKHKKEWMCWLSTASESLCKLIKCLSQEANSYANVAGSTATLRLARVVSACSCCWEAVARCISPLGHESPLKGTFLVNFVSSCSLRGDHSLRFLLYFPNGRSALRGTLLT